MLRLKFWALVTASAIGLAGCVTDGNLPQSRTTTATVAPTSGAAAAASDAAAPSGPTTCYDDYLSKKSGSGVLGALRRNRSVESPDLAAVSAKMSAQTFTYNAERVSDKQTFSDLLYSQRERMITPSKDASRHQAHLQSLTNYLADSGPRPEVRPTVIVFDSERHDAFAGCVGPERNVELSQTSDRRCGIFISKGIVDKFLREDSTTTLDARKRITNYTLYVLAHEYAHILLDHGASREERQEGLRVGELITSAATLYMMYEVGAATFNASQAGATAAAERAAQARMQAAALNTLAAGVAATWVNAEMNRTFFPGYARETEDEADFGAAYLMHNLATGLASSPAGAAAFAGFFDERDFSAGASDINPIEVAGWIDPVVGSHGLACIGQDNKSIFERLTTQANDAGAAVKETTTTLATLAPTLMLADSLGGQNVNVEESLQTVALLGAANWLSKTLQNRYREDGYHLHRNVDVRIEQVDAFVTKAGLEIDGGVTGQARADIYASLDAEAQNAPPTTVPIDAAREEAERAALIAQARGALIDGTLEADAQLAKAATLLEGFRDLDPPNLDANEVLAQIALREQKPAEALALMRPVADDPDAGPNTLLMAIEYARGLGEVDLAASYLDRAADDFQMSRDIIANQIWVARQRDDASEVERLLTECLTYLDQELVGQCQQSAGESATPQVTPAASADAPREDAGAAGATPAPAEAVAETQPETPAEALQEVGQALRGLFRPRN